MNSSSWDRKLYVAASSQRRGREGDRRTNRRAEGDGQIERLRGTMRLGKRRSVGKMELGGIGRG